MSIRMPSLGELNQRIELLKRTTTNDATGGQSTSYISLGNVWAKVRSGPSVAQTIADAIAQLDKTHITIRFRSDIAPGDRLMIDGKPLDVDSIADINGHKAYQKLICSKPTVTGSRHE